MYLYFFAVLHRQAADATGDTKATAVMDIATA